MSTTTQLVTADELLRMPSGRFRYELREGVLLTMSPAGFEHGAIALLLGSLLSQHVRANKLGLVLAAETGYKLAGNPDTVLTPDVSFVRQELIEKQGRTRKFWEGAPDLAVEVMSPDDSVRKTNEKAQEWIAAGAALVWSVNPRNRTVTVRQPSAGVVVRTENDTLDGGNVVPGFSCSVAEIFS